MYKQVILGALKQAFYWLPDVVALVLPGIAAALIFWTEAPKHFERHRIQRIVLTVGCILLGLAAFFATQLQKSEDVTERKELDRQIKILINNSQTQATADEVATVRLSRGAGLLGTASE